jgi:hypothetical protein
MVPDGVAQIWIVNLPLSRGAEWNDWLGEQLRLRIGALKSCWLSVALSHPHPSDYDIKRFTRVQRFPAAEWDIRLARPTVTFIWREDRLWQDQNSDSPVGWKRFLSERLAGRSPNTLSPRAQQTQGIVALVSLLRQQWPTLDFAVAGLGKAGGLPASIVDLRTTEITVNTERAWCERYAGSHVVIGVHGSNMLLPSAHAGAVVELVPPDRWGNSVQATLFGREESRVTAFRFRYVPLSVSSHDLAAITSALLQAHSFMMRSMPFAACDHAAISNCPAEVVETLRAPRAMASL